MKIEIPFKTPSINHLYGQHGFQRYLKPEAKKLKLEIKKILPTDFTDLRGKKLLTKVEVYENWFTKKKEVKRVDVSNREKFLVDSVFEALGLDDKFIFEHTMTKIQSDTEKAIITIEELK